jgi:uncharacterized repeat protein (TIGR01451 family)/CSLREA domain-containing protein
MSRHVTPRAPLLAFLVLAALAGCRDADNSPVGPQPQFAQGDNGVWTVNSLDDPGGDGVCDDAECTLREAIAAAPSGGTVLFQPGLQGTILLTAGQLEIDGPNFQIDGDGRITVDAQGNSRVFSINGSTTSLNGLTLQHGGALVGAGLYVDASTVTLDRVTVANNESLDRGAGIYNDDSELTIRNSTLRGNFAAGVGGGIHINTRFTTRIINSTITINEALQGGGVYVTAGTVEIRGTTISDNQASTGGAITNGSPAGPTPAGGDITITSSTIVRNSATLFTGGVINGGSGASLILANSILAGNAGGDCAGASGGLASAGHNLTTDCSTTYMTATDILVPPAQLFTQVLAQALEDNGGPTRTHALIARGRAIDAGYCPGETEDQRGLGRPVDDPVMPNALDACDIGAYELHGPVAAVADLMISQAVNKTSVKQGERLTYTLRIQNLGPETAPNVVVTDLLPSGTTFVEARHNKGTHTAPPRGETGTVTWSLGDLLDQANEVAELTVTVIVRGKTTITNTASVTGDVADPNAANNAASIKVSIAPGASGKVGKK